MHTTRIYSPDIECESCANVLSRAFKKEEAVTSVSTQNGYVDITHGPAIKTGRLLEIVRSKGYKASLDPTMRKSFGERTREFLSDKQKYAIEHTMLRNAALTLVLLLALEGAFLFVYNQQRPGVLAQYGQWLFYLTLSIVALGSAIWHLKAYRTTVTHMTGMMIGMTLGMQTGMLVGAVIGATNGFFLGALVGMLLGSAVGAYSGYCCGIMGVMEGLMAGVMGGTMGAMITLMMFNDHLTLFMPFYVAINLTILIGLSYMLFEELVEEKDVERTPRGFGTFALTCLLALALLTALIFLAPASIFMGVLA